MQPIGSEEISLSRDSGDFDPGHVAAIGGNRKRLERPFRMVLIEERPVRKTNDRCSMSFVVMVSYISTDGKHCHITGEPDGFDLRRRGIAEEILPLPVKCIEAVSRWMDDRRGQLPVFPIERIDSAEEDFVSGKERITARREVIAAADFHNLGNAALPDGTSVLVPQEPASITRHHREVLPILRIRKSVPDRRRPESLDWRNRFGMEQRPRMAVKDIQILIIFETLCLRFIVIRRRKGEASAAF